MALSLPTASHLPTRPPVPTRLALPSHQCPGASCSDTRLGLLLQREVGPGELGVHVLLEQLQGKKGTGQGYGTREWRRLRSQPGVPRAELSPPLPVVAAAAGPSSVFVAWTALCMPLTSRISLCEMAPGLVKFMMPVSLRCRVAGAHR